MKASKIPCVATFPNRVIGYIRSRKFEVFAAVLKALSFSFTLSQVRDPIEFRSIENSYGKQSIFFDQKNLLTTITKYQDECKPVMLPTSLA